MVNNPFDLLKNFGNVKESFEHMKKEIETIKVKGTAGADAVVIEMNGDFIVSKIVIQKDFFVNLEHNALEQLLKSAFNDAVLKLKEELKLKTMGMLPFGM